MKYNLSEIMKRAWNIVKTKKVTISEALKASWTIAKETISKKVFTDYARVNMSTDGINMYTFKRWTKGHCDRVYMKDNKNRTRGYIDVETLQTFPERGYLVYEECLLKFLELYTIA